MSTLYTHFSIRDKNFQRINISVKTKFARELRTEIVVWQ